MKSPFIKVLMRIIGIIISIAVVTVGIILLYFRIVNPPYETGYGWDTSVAINGCRLGIEAHLDSLDCKDLFIIGANYDPYPRWFPLWLKPRKRYGWPKDSVYNLSYPWVFPNNSMCDGKITPRVTIEIMSDVYERRIGRIDINSEIAYDSLNQLHFSPREFYSSIVDSLRNIFGKHNIHYDRSTTVNSKEMYDGSGKGMDMEDEWDLGERGKVYCSLVWYSSVRDITYTVTLIGKSYAP